MIERLVLDASVALAWVVNPTEQQARGAQAISELIERDAPICAIPHLWHVEIAHQLRALKEAGRLTRIKQLNAVQRLEALTLETHHLGLEVRQVLDLADHLQSYSAPDAAANGRRNHVFFLRALPLPDRSQRHAVSIMASSFR